MAFLDFLRARKPDSGQITELRIGEVMPFVEERAGEKKAVMEKEVPAKFSEIKHLIRETRELLKDLDKAKIEESGNKRFRKAARTAKRDSIKRINAVLHKIEPPFSSEPETVRDYCFESLSVLRQKIHSGARSLAYTSALLKDVMREIGSKIEALEHLFSELVETIKRNSIIFEKGRLFSLVSGVEEEMNELDKSESELLELKKALEAITKARSQAATSLETLLNSAPAAELKSLEERKKKLMLEKLELRNQLINTVAGAGRPLRKLSNLVSKEKYFLGRESLHALLLFLDDPIKLFRQDPKGEKFKALLKELKGAIVSEKLGFKEKEREKKLAEIDRLLKFDFFSSFFWKENELEKELNEISTKESSMQLKKEVDELKRRVVELEHDFNQTSNAVRELSVKIAALKAKKAESLEALGRALSKLTGEKIKIVEEAQEPKPEKPNYGSKNQAG